jgi:hypothetical protein
MIRAKAGIFALLFLPGFILNSFAQTNFQQVLNNGPRNHRINLVFLAEGFTSIQSQIFSNRVNDTLFYLFKTPPLNEYTNYFNVFTIFVPSAQPGSDHPSLGFSANTFFNSSYDSYGQPQLITIPPNNFDTNYSHGQGKVDSLLQKYVPEYDLATMLVNDTTYGGSASTTGGGLAITSLSPTNSQDYRETLMHEIGHVFAELGDEYDDPLPEFEGPEEPNTTVQTVRSLIKWKAWIKATTPIPTPEFATNGAVVGLFQGAHYHPTGWYRPKLNCKMNSLFRPFCEICAEAFVLNFNRLAPPLDTFSPAATFRQVTNQADLTFAVTTLRPSTHSMNVQWFLNGSAVTDATNTSLTISPAALPSGTNIVRVEVTDPTPLVRTDPNSYLKSVQNWTNRVSIVGGVSLTNPGLSTNRSFRFTIPGNGAQNYVIQGSSNLTSWLPIFTNSFPGTNYTFTDGQSRQLNRRFYRVVFKP